MKPHNNIDDYFKDNLSQSEIPMSGVEDLWNKIDPNKPRKKFPFFLWFVLGFVGLIMVGWFIFNLNIKESNLVETQQLDTSIADKTVQETEASILSPNAVQQETQDPINTSTIVAPSSVLKKNINRIINSNSDSQRTASSSLVSSPFTLGLNSESKNDSHPSSSIYSKSSIQKEAYLPIAEYKKDQLTKLGLLSVKSDYGLDYMRPLPLLQGLLTPTIKERIKPARLQKLWYGQVSLTSSLVSNKLSVEGMDPTSISEDWNRSVDPLASFQFALSLGRRINSKSSIDIGLEYQHIENQYQQDTLIIETQSRFNPEAYYTSSGFRGDSVLVETTTKGTIMKSLRETLINIPLRYNYNIVRRGHFGLDASLGLIMNLSRQRSGPSLNSNNEWTIVTGQSQNRIGFSYDLSLLSTYALNNDQSLFLSPRFRYSPSDHLEGLPFNLSRVYVGMELGYRMAF